MDKKEKAKQVKIESLYKGEFKQWGAKKLQGKCPFHDDVKEPNFFIYPATNTWWCYKCHMGGDSISFYMKLHNCNFKEALEALN